MRQYDPSQYVISGEYTVQYWSDTGHLRTDILTWNSHRGKWLDVYGRDPGIKEITALEPHEQTRDGRNQ